MRHQFQHKSWARVMGLMIMALMILGGSSIRNAQGCVFDTLADIPLEAKTGSSPGIIMFLLDDSGSMQWSLILDGVDYVSSQGVFEYPAPTDEKPNHTKTFIDVFKLYNADKDYQMFWKTQWTGVNKLYYNPNSTYDPWPGELNADPDDPANPYFTSDHKRLDDIYYDFSVLDPSEIEDAVGAVIIDNSDVGETIEDIVDDGDDGYSSYEDNDGDGTADDPEDWISGDCSNCNAGDYVRIYGADPKQGDMPFRAVHSFDLKFDDEYEVFVQWYSFSTRGEVTYTVHHAVDPTVPTVHVINQNAGSDGASGWVSLGIYNFTAGQGNAEVSLVFSGVGGDSVSTDAVKLVPQNIVLDKFFESTGSWSNPVDNVDAYKDNYVYSNKVGDYTAAWTTNTLDPDINYNVYVRWHVGGKRSNSVKHSLIHDGGTETKYFNQQQHSDMWMELATDVSFSSGQGMVLLEHSMSVKGQDKSAADAVAFVPSDQVSTSAISIANSHYYVTGSDDNTYLVNIINNGFEYYRVDHSLGLDSDESVDPGGDSDKIVDKELVEINETDAQNAGIAVLRTYSEERQNFANWFAFYRKRQYTAKNAVGRVIDDMSGVRIGILGINSKIEQEALPVNVTIGNATYDRTDDLLSALYAHNPSGGTPLRKGLQRVGNYFEGTDTMNDATDDLAAYISETSEPYFTESDGGSCGQAFCILMTDGYYNGSSPGVGNTDTDGAGDFDGGVFADEKLNTLADVAMHYYERDLNTDLTDSVPVTNLDQADHQHMVTYAVSFGVTGAISRETYNTCPLGDCPPEWWVTGADSNKQKNKQKIDDLFHAAVNGRGEYINAGTPEELSAAMDELKTQISARLGSASSVASNSIEMRAGSKIYQGTYYSDNWSGELLQYGINVAESTVGDIEWRASEKLNAKDWDTRVIYSYDGTDGILFENTATDALAPDLVNYLRGDTSNNLLATDGIYRVRGGKLGDIVHSAPYIYGDVVYVGANDGMLHAFNRADGEELFAYVPKILVDKGTLPSLASANYTHLYYVDHTPYVQKTDTETLLVGGLRKGGKGYYCLNVDGENAAEVVKWEYSASADADPDLGYSYSRAYIVKTNSDQWVVIFGNGYDSDNEEAVLYVLNASTGEVINKIYTGVAGCNGMGPPGIADVDGDEKIDYVYAGDLKGNLWKFDFTTDSNGVCAYMEGDVCMPLITVTNSDGSQPITTEPNIMRMECAADQKGYFVTFGTGQYLGTNDPATVTQQAFYGVWDWQDEFTDSPESTYLGVFNASEIDPLLSHPPDDADTLTLLEQTIDMTISGYRILSDNTINWFVPGGDATDEAVHAGWYFNLVDTGARVNQDSMIRPGDGKDVSIVTFISSVPSVSTCGGSAGHSWLYQASACNGGMPDDAQFDTDEDGEVTAHDKLEDPDNTDDPDKSPTGKKFPGLLPPPIMLIGDPPVLIVPDPDDPTKIITEVLPDNMQGIFYWRMIEN